MVADGGVREFDYRLEQDLADFVEDLGFQVRTSAAFEDPDEGKSREVNVLAFTDIYRDGARKFGLGAELIVECKNSSFPLVFIGRRMVDVQPPVRPDGQELAEPPGGAAGSYCTTAQMAATSSSIN